jgi:DNA-binding transcriptional MerR regulator
MTLAEIAETLGLPARTIQFYIARSPLTVRQKAAAFRYTTEHLVRLERIKRLQADGHTLFEIGRILSGPSAKKSSMEPPTARWQSAIADDVIVAERRR